jgi:cyclic-di-GMP phosphodiesterase, flagellum assembly factor TipF
MQSLIKGLADKLNGPMVKVEAPRTPVAPAPVAPALDTVEGQVGALREASEDMRDSLAAPALGGTDPGPALGMHDALARAIEASRIDVYLDPILGLDDRRARHFEVSVRLRSEDGEILDPNAYADAIGGTGLTPRIEALTFTESIRLAGEFAARGAAADLFSSASGESLRNGGFHAAIDDALAPDAALAARLVMSIAQAEVRAFGPAHWEALAVLSQASLRYALVDVVDLDMDFEALADRDFEFVRLDAQVFLQGLPAPHGFVPAADLCRHLSGLGFTLIVSRIAEERELVKVLGFGALLGQGRLFGGPRPIRQERTPRTSSAA